MSITLNWENVDIEKFTLCKSGKNLKLRYDNQDFKIITDVLYCPFDSNVNTFTWMKHKQWSLTCNIISGDFKIFLKNMSNKIKYLLEQEQLLDSSYEYRDLYTQKGQYMSLRLNLKRKSDGKFLSNVFSPEREIITFNDVDVKNLFTKKYIKTIIECEKIYLYNGKCGSVWCLDQGRFQQENTDIQLSEENENDEGNNNITECLIDD